MKSATIELIFRGFNAQNVRYIVAGGIAVVAHGYPRMTFDLDLIIQLKRDNILKALAVLADLGYRPMVPEQPERFADEESRIAWIRDRGMKVFQMRSETHQETPIDIFVEEPFDFDAWHDRCPQETIADGVPFHFAAAGLLLDMKRKAHREKDLGDIAFLERVIAEERSGHAAGQ
jgi:hypothetical protein